MSAVIRQLVAREFHQHRAMLLLATLVGLGSLVVAAGGSVAFNVGFLVWLTALIALGVLLAMFGVTSERKERALLFVLSLPLSPAGYVRAKLLGLLLCFLGPWAVLSGGALALVSSGPNGGLLPFAVLLCVYLLLNFTLVLCATFHFRSEAALGGVIILTNMGVSLFMMGVTQLPGLSAHMTAAVPVWNETFWLALALELGATALALSLPLLVAARRRDPL